MAKRQNRLGAIEHERRQLGNLKKLEPNATPDKYRALSDALVDIALAALSIVHGLESGDKSAVDFDSFYARIDGLEDSLDG